MAEHFCKKHGVPFFKRGAMKGFGHPILDENGDKTGEWCNEPKVEGQEPESRPTAKPTYGQDSPEKRRSIERQTSAQIAFANIPSPGTIREGLVLAEAIYQWISQGTIPPVMPPSMPEKQSTAGVKAEPATSSPEKEEGKPPVEDLGIDMDWLRESLTKLQWAAVPKWLKNKYPQSIGIKVSEIVKSLTLEQRKEFAKEVENRLQMS